MTDEEFKQRVKKALKQIKEDEDHERLHSYIRKRIAERLKKGQTGGAFCGRCMKNISATRVNDVLRSH